MYSTAELLYYEALIEPDIVLLKDGALLSAFQYRGSDLATASARERAVVAQYVNNAIKRISDGYCLHFEAIRVPSTEYPENHYFSETITEIIDMERKKIFQRSNSHYETITYCFITWQPRSFSDTAAKGILSFTEKLLSLGKIGKPSKPAEPTEQEIISEHRITLFRDTITDITNSLSVVLTTKRLEGVELLSALNYCVNGKPVNKSPEIPWALDCLFAREIENGYPLIYNDEYIMAISIDGFPPDSIPSMLSYLGQLPFQYRWSSRYIPFDFKTAYARMSRIQKKWAQKETPMLAQLFDRPTKKTDKDAGQQVDDVNDALAQLHQGNISFGHYTGTIIIRDVNRDRLMRHTQEAVRCLEETLFKVKAERLNTLEAFLGSLPGNTSENVRKPLIHSLNLAHLLMLSSPWPGLTYNPCSFYPHKSPALIQCASSGGNPFRLHLHVSDVGHTLILGPTGSGKSTLLATIAAQFDRYENSQIFIFDKGCSMYPLISAMKNSSFYQLGDDETPVSLCPLSCLETAADIAWANEYIENLVILNDGEITPERRREIQDTVQAMAGGTARAEDRTLTYLQIAIQDSHLKNVLTTYTSSGPYGKYLDGKETSIKYSRVTAFELEELMRRGTKLTTPTLMYLFHEIEKRLTGAPTLIILDEAWLVMANKLFSQQLAEWLKVLRKANAAVILATQTLTDVLQSDISSAILDSCPTKIMLSNTEVKSEAMKNLYFEQLRLTETEVETIAAATPKRDYFYISPLGRRLFSLDLGPLQLAFLGSSGKEDIKQIKALKQQHGREWPFYWLQEKGLSKWADYWNELERGNNDEI